MMSPKMVERVPPTRPDPHSPSSSDDDSKTRHVSLSTRATNHFSRSGYLCPFLLLSLSLLLFLSLLSPNTFGCFDPVSRIRLFGSEEPGPDFGSLGVPWCGGHSCFKDSDEARIRSRRRKFWEKAVDIEELCGPGEAWWGVKGHMRDDFNHSNKPISYTQHFENSIFVESVLDVYWEVPPVAGPSLTHQTRYDPARVANPIVEDGRFGLFQRLGLSQFDSSVFNGYTQMVYLQVSAQKS